MKSTHKKVPLDNLSTDVVQRLEGVDRRRVEKYAYDFRTELLGSITVSERSDGRLIVLDGAHRVSAARLAGHSSPMQAEVFVNLDIASEAFLFAGRNSGKNPSALSVFNARVLMGELEANEITTIASEHQWKIGIGSEPGVINAVAALESVYRSGGSVLPDGKHPDLLSRVLELLTAAWEWAAGSTDGAMLLAVAQLVGRFGPGIDTKKLIGEMQGTRPGVLVGRAKTLREVQGGTVPAALAKILAGMHNNRRRTNLLPEWVWIR